MGSATSKLDAKGREKVECLECGKYYHRLDVHLSSIHGINVEQYRFKHPGAPTISAAASKSASKRSRSEKSSADESHIVHGVDMGEVDTSVYTIGCAKLKHREDLSPMDQEYVPEHDPHFVPFGEREMGYWEALALAMECGENALMVGPTGCGKSSSALELAAVINQPVRRVNLHGDVRASNFIGKMGIVVDEKTGQSVTKWQDGVLVQAMRNGHWLVLDELDAAPPAILFVLQSVLESGARLTLVDNDGEIVKAHHLFRVIATANTLGRGDDSGLYAGTNTLNEAFLDRFTTVIQYKYPAPSTECKIVQERAGIDLPTAEKMVEVASKVRTSAQQEQCYCTFSTRRLIAWACKYKRMASVTKAAKLTVLNKLDADDAKFVGDLIQRHFGSKGL